MTGTIHCTELEGIGYRIGDRIREGMVVGIVINDTYERIVVRYVVGLTYQRYLQFRIAYGPELAPVTLETICRRTVPQREGNLQRIDDIDVLAAYHHIRRAVTRGRNGASRKTDAALGIIAFTVKITCVGDEAEGLIGFPFPATGRQVRHVGLLFATAINHAATHQHRVFLIRLVGRLDSYRHVGVVTEDDCIAVGISTVVEQVVLLLQIAP